MSAHGGDAHRLSKEGAARLRAFRLSLGYETAAAFARAIGYKPDRYQRYERRFPMLTGPVISLVEAIWRVQYVSVDWLLFGDPTYQPPSMPGSKVAIFTRLKALR